MSTSERLSPAVVAVALAGPGGDVAVRRAVAAGVPVTALAEQGSLVPPGVVRRLDVAAGEARIGAAVRAAVAEGTAWLAVPRTLGTPEYLLGATVRSVGRHLDGEHPGVALLVADPDREDRPYRELLAVLDTTRPAPSGLGAWVAVGLAVRLKARLTVLLLGVPEDAPLSTRAERLAHLAGGRRPDLLTAAVERADAEEVREAWLAGGEGRAPVDVLSEVLAETRYDLVVDDLGGLALNLLEGRRGVERLVADPAVGGVPLWLLRHAPCDVAVVVDGIDLGLVPAAAVRAGVVAALALGGAGVAASPVGAAGPLAGTGALPVVERPVAAPPVVERPQPGSTPTDSEPQPVGGEPPPTPPPGPEPTPEPEPEPVPADAGPSAEVTPEQMQQAQAEADGVLVQAAGAEAAAATAAVVAADAAAAAAAAQALLDEQRAAASPAAAALADARAERREADLRALAADDEHARVTAAATGLAALLPGSPGPDELAEVEKTLREAERAASRAHAEAAERYAQYQAFAADVAAAVQAVDRAERTAAQAQSAAHAAQEAAVASRAHADQVAAATAALREAYRAGGLVFPATGGVTSPFGMRVHPVTGAYKLHTGVDFEGTDGQYYAAAAGVVSHAGYDGAYGYLVKIDHGVVGGYHVETWYAHQPGLRVAVGQAVAQGEVVGEIGSSGYSTGRHAHFELLVDGTPIDPLPHLR